MSEPAQNEREMLYPPQHQKLDQVIEAVRGYHFALDMRQHGGGAAHQCLDQIMRVLDMPWQQGDELRRRSQARKEDAKEQVKK